MKNIIRYCGLLLVGLVSCMEDEAPSVELNVALDKQVYQVGEPDRKSTRLNSSH